MWPTSTQISCVYFYGLPLTVLQASCTRDRKQRCKLLLEVRENKVGEEWEERALYLNNSVSVAQIFLQVHFTTELSDTGVAKPVLLYFQL